MRLYTASATRHVSGWRHLRKDYPSITWTSTWLDEVGTGSRAEEAAVSPERFARCWEQNVRDVLSSDVLLLYHKDSDLLRGAFIEAGIALGAGIPVSIVSDNLVQLSSWIWHPKVKVESSLSSFLDRMANAPNPD